MEAICGDLAAEHAELDAVVAGLNDGAWLTATPALGWNVADQISHLWFFDQRAALALTDHEAFAADIQWLAANGGTDASVAAGRALAPTELLGHWRHDRQVLLAIAADVDPSTRVPWYGPPMAARSFITARLMETWAHGQDVVDALHIVRTPTARLRHVAHLGVRARPFSYAVNSMPLPEVDVAVRLTGPDGDVWEWGPQDAADVVTGDALDFCLVVTQRRHLADTDLRIVGSAAAEWMGIAQAFAGEPGAGRERGQFTDR